MFALPLRPAPEDPHACCLASRTTACEASPTAGKSSSGKNSAAQAARLRPDLRRLGEPGQAAKLALRSVARQIQDLSASITELDRALAPLVDGAAPRTRALLGVGTQHAAQLLLTIGQNAGRLRNEAASMRCLKRYLARELYRTLTADLKHLAASP